MLELEEGRYDLSNGIYLNVESYDIYRFEERMYESHLKYLDIQCILLGCEYIVVESISNLQIEVDYSADKDIVFYSNSIVGNCVLLEGGKLLLLTPEDAHMPCIRVNESAKVKKAVFKISINY